MWFCGHSYKFPHLDNDISLFDNQRLNPEATSKDFLPSCLIEMIKNRNVSWRVPDKGTGFLKQCLSWWGEFGINDYLIWIPQFSSLLQIRRIPDSTRVSFVMAIEKGPSILASKVSLRVQFAGFFPSALGEYVPILMIGVWCSSQRLIWDSQF